MKKGFLLPFFLLLTTLSLTAQQDTTTHLQPANTSPPPAKKDNFVNHFANVFLNKNKHHRDTTNVEPFGWGDFTWLNGNDRRHDAALASKYVTGILLIDVNYTASFAHPIDNTVVGSTALARNNEIQLSMIGLGGEFNYKNVRAKVILQFGTRTATVPRNDASNLRGGYNLSNAYKYFSEAYAGYHFNAMHGINLDAGIFMSYVGLFSYYNAENWSYQPSFTSDNTPWYFNGIRLQMFPSTKFKQEIWLINGWQTYGKFNNMPGFGSQSTWSPNERVRFVSNNYFGTDVQGNPKAYRFHSDNSFLYRYYNNPTGKVSKAAFCVTGDFGFQKGGGFGAFSNSPTDTASNFISAMAYNRVWFGKDHFAWTIGGGLMHNPSRYLVLYPTGDADPNINPTTGKTIGTHPFATNLGSQFEAWDCSTTIDWMPNDMITFRVELVHREASEPYFAGHGGVTSPDGYAGTPITPGWTPDLVKSETRFIGALLVRF